jgi:hypothetical protein
MHCVEARLIKSPVYLTSSTTQLGLETNLALALKGNFADEALLKQALEKTTAELIQTKEIAAIMQRVIEADSAVAIADRYHKIHAALGANTQAQEAFKNVFMHALHENEQTTTTALSADKQRKTTSKAAIIGGGVGLGASALVAAGSIAGATVAAKKMDDEDGEATAAAVGIGLGGGTLAAAGALGSGLSLGLGLNELKYAHKDIQHHQNQLQKLQAVRAAITQPAEKSKLSDDQLLS